MYSYFTLVDVKWKVTEVHFIGEIENFFEEEILKKDNKKPPNMYLVETEGVEPSSRNIGT